MRIRLTVNGRIRDAEVPAGTSLLSVLRDDLGLTGTHYGCGHGACGACYVLADGQPVAACMLSVEEAAGKSLVTVEGLAEGESLHPVQRAFLEEDAMQCGYCTAGMLVSAAALLARTPHPTDDEIRDALAPHLCRCGVYLRAARAVKRASR
jgi:aerobic-type carbon monoxide dehydrogenase small subunit (CoxS/CutS family)